MKKFIFIFRFDGSIKFEPTSRQLEEKTEMWNTWISKIAEKRRLVDTKKLDIEGKTLYPNGIIVKGAYTEIKNIISGYLIAKAESLDEAMILARSCPILFIGGSVEVREIME